VTAKKTGVPEDLRNAEKILVKVRPAGWSAILFKSTDKKDLEALWRSVAVEPPRGVVSLHVRWYASDLCLRALMGSKDGE
jgi:hypothetical protein